MSKAPSEIARAAVPHQWGEVQSWRKVGPGIFGVSCSGHGGLIVVDTAATRVANPQVGWLDTLEKTAETVWEGRFRAGGRSRRLLCSDQWQQPLSFEKAHKVYVLEEDCDWCHGPLIFEADWTPTGGMFSFLNQAEAIEHAEDVYGRWFAPQLPEQITFRFA